MKILIIPGHGAADSGAYAFKRREADLTRELSLLVKKELEKFECTCDVYNLARSMYHDIIVEGYKFNFSVYNYVFEIHFNAFEPDNGDGKPKGSEAYVTTDEQITTVEDKLLGKMAKLGFKNRGIKRKNFSVIAEAKRQGTSATLFEVCFMDDADDMKIYMAKKNDVAKVIAEAIAEGYTLRAKKAAVFTDVSGHWAENEITELYQKGIISGYADGTFKPDKPITRAEVAVMLAKAIK